jgi:hemoglobin
MTTADATDTKAPTEATPYEIIGGEAVVRHLADRFYEIMDSDPRAARIRAMHGQDLEPIKQLLFEFLSGWLGGPSLYFNRPQSRCIMSAHQPFAIGEIERDQWMNCMRAAMEECALPSDLRSQLDRAFLRMAGAFRTR